MSCEKHLVHSFLKANQLQFQRWRWVRRKTKEHDSAWSINPGSKSMPETAGCWIDNQVLYPCSKDSVLSPSIEDVFLSIWILNHLITFWSYLIKQSWRWLGLVKSLKIFSECHSWVKQTLDIYLVSEQCKTTHTLLLHSYLLTHGEGQVFWQNVAHKQLHKILQTHTNSWSTAIHIT